MADKGYTMISEEMLGELAMRVATILESNSISRLIPKEVAKWLSESIFGYAQQYEFLMPLSGGAALRIKMKVNIDGSIEMVLADSSNYDFWKGTLREMK